MKKSVILMFITLTTSIVLGVQNYQLKNQEPTIIRVEEYIPVIDDTNGMPEDVKYQTQENHDEFLKYPIAAFSHVLNVSFYIYFAYDIDDNGKKINYYYYAFNSETIDDVDLCEI